MIREQLEISLETCYLCGKLGERRLMRLIGIQIFHNEPVNTWVHKDCIEEFKEADHHKDR